MGTSTASYTEGPMNLSGLLPVLAADAAVARVRAAASAAPAARDPELDVVLPPGLRAVLLASLLDGGPSPLVVVVATGREAEELAAALQAYAPSTPTRSPSCRRGRRSRTSVSRPAATPWRVGWPCSAGSPTLTPRAPVAR